MIEDIVVYFAGAIRGDRAMEDMMINIVRYVKSLEVKVLSEHVGTRSTIDEIPAEDIERRDIEWLDNATHVIAEITGASTGTGREIEYARAKGHFGKIPASVLCLYHKGREFYASPMIRGMTMDRYPNVSVASYNDLDEAKSIIKRFLFD